MVGLRMVMVVVKKGGDGTQLWFVVRGSGCGGERMVGGYTWMVVVVMAEVMIVVVMTGVVTVLMVTNYNGDT